MNSSIGALITDYLKDKELAWAPSTRKSEASRLNAIVEVLQLTGFEPKALYVALKGNMKPYTLKTLFIRLSSFEAWAVDENRLEGPARFPKFMRQHANLFKHAYKTERVPVTFQEARVRISEINDSEIRAKAMDLLLSGMRYKESTDVQPGGHIIGKGGKPRKVFGARDFAGCSFSYQTFWRKLKEIGLKPHTLRKLWATELGNKGASSADLMELAGWSSIQTAGRYLQPKRDEALMVLTGQLRG